jgi:hypothetical protein
VGEWEWGKSSQGGGACTHSTETEHLGVLSGQPGEHCMTDALALTSRKNSRLLASCTTAAVRPAALLPLPLVYTQMGATWVCGRGAGTGQRRDQCQSRKQAGW